MNRVSPWPRRARIIMTLLVAAGLGAGGWYAVARGQPSPVEQARAEEAKPAPPVGVEVIQPSQGGIQRVCVQPGSVEPFEYADLYAKASGYLVEQTVDIGSRVKKGDVLARISVPEYEKRVSRDDARVRDANAKVKQMDAHLAAARAESRAADASVVFANVLVRAKTAYRQYRFKQLTRFKELLRERAIEA